MHSVCPAFEHLKGVTAPEGERKRESDNNGTERTLTPEKGHRRDQELFCLCRGCPSHLLLPAPGNRVPALRWQAVIKSRKGSGVLHYRRNSCRSCSTALLFIKSWLIDGELDLLWKE